MTQEDQATNLSTLHQKTDEYSRKIAKSDFEGALTDLDAAISVCPAGLFLGYLQHERHSLKSCMPNKKGRVSFLKAKTQPFRGGVHHNDA